jgi:hypothetical protein
MNDKLERIRKEAVVASFKVILGLEALGENKIFRNKKQKW